MGAHVKGTRSPEVAHEGVSTEHCVFCAWFISSISDMCILLVGVLLNVFWKAGRNVPPVDVDVFNKWAGCGCDCNACTVGWAATQLVCYEDARCVLGLICVLEFGEIVIRVWDMRSLQFPSVLFTPGSD